MLFLKELLSFSLYILHPILYASMQIGFSRGNSLFLIRIGKINLYVFNSKIQSSTHVRVQDLHVLEHIEQHYPKFQEGGLCFGLVPPPPTDARTIKDFFFTICIGFFWSKAHS